MAESAVAGTPGGSRRVCASGFRSALRRATANEHLATETLFAPFLNDASRRLGWYLAVQRSALWALMQGCPPESAGCTASVMELVSRLDGDLAAMGVMPRATPAPDRLDPLAVDYLVFGSRLGTEVIRRQIFGDTPVDDVPTYFRAKPRPDLWRIHCVSLDRIDPQSTRASRITRDVKTGFAVFDRAAQEQRA